MRKVLLVAVPVLVALVTGLALVLPLLVEVDGYRADIEGILARATGRDVELGELQLRILPVPVLRASGIQVGEDPGFGVKPFLSAESVTVRVSLLPLLTGTLEVGRLTIQEPNVRLHRRGDAWNLASLLRAGAGAGSAEPPGGPPGAGAGSTVREAPGPGARAEGGPGRALAIREVLLTAGSIRLLDEALPGSEPVRLKATDIDLRLNDLTATSPIRFEGSLTIGGAGKARIHGSIGPLAVPEGAAGLPFDADVVLEQIEAGAFAPWLQALAGLRVRSGTIGLEAHLARSPSGEIQVEGDVSLARMEVDPIFGDGVPVDLSAEATLAGSLGAQTTQLTRGTVRVGGAEISITGSLTGLDASPRLRVNLRTEDAPVAGVLPVIAILGPFVPEGLRPAGKLSLDAAVGGELRGGGRLAIEGRASLDGLELADAAISEPIRGISGTATFEGETIAITALRAALGRTSVEGRCTIKGFDAPQVSLSIRSPRLDLDEILMLVSGTGARPAVQAAGLAAAPAQGTADPPAEAREDTAFGALSLRGDLTADAAKLMNLDLTGLRAGVSLQDGAARLEEIAVNLYGGSLTGGALTRIDQPGLPFELQAGLSGVDFDGLVTGLSPGLSGLLFGTLQASLALQGDGIDPRSLRSALEGTASFSLADGRITSVGVLKTLGEALEAAGGKGIGEEETPFSYLGGTFRIKRGKARTEDLRLESPDLSMKGEGSLTLDLDLDLDLTARLSPEVTAALIAHRENLRFLRDSKERLRVDLNLGGTLAEPRVGVDPDMIRRVIKEATREHLKGKAGERLKELLGGKDG